MAQQHLAGGQRDGLPRRISGLEGWGDENVRGFEKPPQVRRRVGQSAQGKRLAAQQIGKLVLNSRPWDAPEGEERHADDQHARDDCDTGSSPAIGQLRSEFLDMAKKWLAGIAPAERNCHRKEAKSRENLHFQNRGKRNVQDVRRGHLRHLTLFIQENHGFHG
jgi:hypothetical protein